MRQKRRINGSWLLQPGDVIFLLAGALAHAGVETGHAVLVVHGGEADMLSGVPAERYREGMRRALEAGYRALKHGSSLDAVEAAVRVLEDSEWFNAGRGAVFTHEGRNEMDAAIMEGTHKHAGAVASVTTIKNPISAARLVMEKSPHVLLAGIGAEQFIARTLSESSDTDLRKKVKLVDPHYFWTEGRWEELQQEWKKQASKGHAALDGKKHHLGTVGAVAVKDGKVAAATSTGGMTNKLSGRIGDSPIIGAGTYADDKACAVSATGWGEYFIENVVGHDIAARIQYGHASLEKALDSIIDIELQNDGAEGGAIAITPKGEFAIAFNRLAQQMSRGYVTADGKISIAITEEKLPPPK